MLEFDFHERGFALLHVVTFILLFIVWIFFSGKLDLFHLSLGFISCAIVAALSGELLFQRREKKFLVRLVEFSRFVPYCFWLLYQIILANFHVIALALSPKLMKRDLDPHIFTFKTALTTDLARFVLANSITLTPGTVTIRIHEDIFYIHAVSRKAAGDLATPEAMSEMEKRVRWVFEPDRARGDAHGV